MHTDVKIRVHLRLKTFNSMTLKNILFLISVVTKNAHHHLKRNYKPLNGTKRQVI